jgi:hypothetical protein
MTRKSVVVVVLAAVVLAGCAGPQSTGTPTADTPTEDANSIDVDEIPGITNGSLTDAAALAEANGETLAETGGRLKIFQSTGQAETEFLFTIGSGGSYSLVTDRTATNGQSNIIEYWSNESGTYVRSQTDSETRYRALEREPGVLDSFNSTLEAYLAAGSFTVGNETNGGTAVVLTADEFGSLDAGGPLSEAESLSGRLVVSQAGQIQNLTITGQQNGQAVRFQYELMQPLIERASKPGWVSEMPASATLHPELNIDVENDSTLVIENQGGDPVPANATLTISTDSKSGSATFDSALAVDDTRYAYFSAASGKLTLSSEKPTASDAASVTSPLSATVTAGDGVTLHSVSMGWGSASANASSDGSSGEA